jgi:hypothetical protein
MADIFEMFGKSVAQLMRRTLTQQSTVDEVRQQCRFCQAQIVDLNSMLSDFDGRLPIELQIVRPTVDTRDEVPLDAAQDGLQKSPSALSERTHPEAQNAQA